MSTDGEEASEDGEEISPRSKTVGTILSLISPGLGLTYVGEPGRGLSMNATVVLALAGFVGLTTVSVFFVIPPLVVLLGGVAALSAWTAHEVRRLVDERGARYEPEPYNHWTVYTAGCLLTYVLPIAAVAVFAETFVLDLRTVETSASHPTLRRGDVVIVRKDAYRRRAPRRGDLVAVDAPGADPVRFLRVVAGPGETVQMRANLLYVDGRYLPRRRLSEAHVRVGRLDRQRYDYLIERNGTTAYPIAVDPGAAGRVGFDQIAVEDGQWVALADNRTAGSASDDASRVRDSRSLGPLSREVFAGRPAHIAWSTSPETGDIQWHRIGLDVR